LKRLAVECSCEIDLAAKLVNFPGVRIALVRDARAISGRHRSCGLPAIMSGHAGTLTPHHLLAQAIGPGGVFSSNIENRPAVLFELWHLPPLGFGAEDEPRYRRVSEQQGETITFRRHNSLQF
jgi:hypothetical protein